LVSGFVGLTTATVVGRFFEAAEAGFLGSFRGDFLGTAFLLFALAFGRGRAFFAGFFPEDFGRGVGLFLSVFLLAIRLQHRSEPASPVGSQETKRASLRSLPERTRLLSNIRVILEVWLGKKIRLD
jgi:hypothetical protein